MPPLDEGDLLYMPTTDPGISITKARELLQQTDALIASFPEVHHVFGKIGRGETLSAIAARYGTTITAVASFNNIRNPHRIRVGQYLVIPIGPDGAMGGELYAGVDGGSFTYRVRRGDTVSSIARRHGKRTKDVLRANGLGWHTRIYPGDTLKIPM